MDTLKKFAIYALILIVFFVFSNFLIFVGLNSTYKSIDLKGDMPEQVNIDRAEATAVNGRIYGNIKEIEENDLNGKFLEINLYSKRNIFLGRTYVTINSMENKNEQEINLHFKLQNISYYSIAITNNKIENEEKEIELISDDLTRTAIIVGVVIGLINAPFIWFAL